MSVHLKYPKWSQYFEIKLANEGLLGSLYRCFHWRYTAKNLMQLPQKMLANSFLKKTAAHISFSAPFST